MVLYLYEFYFMIRPLVADSKGFKKGREIELKLEFTKCPQWDLLINSVLITKTFLINAGLDFHCPKPFISRYL